MSARIREDCRLCGARGLETVLELAPTPPANELLKQPDPLQEKFPLYLARCPGCGHVQLPVVVDPARLFRDYVYVSGTSPSFRDHFSRYAYECIDTVRLQRGAEWHSRDLVVEIGSNDGTMLRCFKDYGLSVLGVDPAVDIARRATADGIDTLPEFFTREVAAQILSRGKRPALVVANNVFAHADDLREIAQGVRDMLEPTGWFVFEVQYLVDLVQHTLFDMVYHEHLSYHSLGPLVRFLDSVGMTLVDAEHVDTHGGSIRCWARAQRGAPTTARLKALLEHEVQALALAVDPWGDLRRRIGAAGEKLRAFLDGERSADRAVVGYGAPAKLTTLCHQFCITREDIAVVVDDSPWKQGLLTPGTCIPIVPWDRLEYAAVPPSIVIFAWNFAEPIAKKLRAGGFAGKIVTPLPVFKELP